MKRILIVIGVVMLLVALAFAWQLFGLSHHGGIEPARAAAMARHHKHPSPREQRPSNLYTKTSSSSPKKAGRVSRKGWQTSAVTAKTAAYVYGYRGEVYEVTIRGHWQWNGRRVRHVTFTRDYWKASWSVWNWKGWTSQVNGGNRVYRYRRDRARWDACVPWFCTSAFPTVSLTLRADGTMKAGSS